MEKNPTNLCLSQATILLSEPYFYTSILPWHNIFYWYARTDLASLLVENPKVSLLLRSLMSFEMETLEGFFHMVDV